MSSATSPEMESLKSRLKTTWEAGDFSEVAKHIEKAAEQFVERLNVQPGMKVLDVACGSGNLAVEAARKGADVTGLDLAENLVEAARKRAEATGLNIKFEQGDAENLPYEDNNFDLVMTMYGAMFAPRPEMVASELVRVCKPSGRIAMANWTPEGFAGQMFKLSGKYLPPPNMPPPVQWGVPEIVEQRFGDRVTNLQMNKRLADMVFEYGPAEVVDHFRNYFGPTVMAFKAIPAEHHEDFRQDLENIWTQNNTATDGTTHVKGEYLEVIAEKK
ncbi:MAG TPA: class I SAM-dependent methyltransferase [Pyrinomonadaceae bacterium]|nr:class I SAM-dependent methyltransferase [Pyrinomonadaceae bacterium]